MLTSCVSCRYLQNGVGCGLSYGSFDWDKKIDRGLIGVTRIEIKPEFAFGFVEDSGFDLSLW